MVPETISDLIPKYLTYLRVDYMLVSLLKMKRLHHTHSLEIEYGRVSILAKYLCSNSFWGYDGLRLADEEDLVSCAVSRDLGGTRWGCRD
jgi:hypothetical protein